MGIKSWCFYLAAPDGLIAKHPSAPALIPAVQLIWHGQPRLEPGTLIEAPLLIQESEPVHGDGNDLLAVAAAVGFGALSRICDRSSVRRLNPFAD